jgi:hypothetical protein
MAPSSSPWFAAGCALGAWFAAVAPGCVGGRPDAPASGAARAGDSSVRVAGAAAGARELVGETRSYSEEPRRVSPNVEDVLVPVEARELSVTSGEIIAEGPRRFSIRSPTFRAELGHAPRSAAEVSFVYRGPTQELARLASGEPRRQIGLKLRARDTCNVVYAMWHIAPSAGIVVSVKTNPGQSRHAECGDRGYSFLEPASAKPAPRIEPGEPHVLAAEIRGRTLLVKTDGQTSWEGELPAAAFEFDGPVGVRSDNGEFSVALRAEELVQ